MSSIPICSVCYEKFTTTSIVQSTECGHIFHDNCIRRWLNDNSTCAECRHNAQPLRRLYLNFNDSEEEIPQQNATAVAPTTRRTIPTTVGSTPPDRPRGNSGPGMSTLGFLYTTPNTAVTTTTTNHRIDLAREYALQMQILEFRFSTVDDDDDELLSLFAYL